MFIDTSGLMCLFDARDHRHSSAIRYFDSTKTRLTHSYVLAEFVALATARRAPPTQTLQFVKAIGENSEIEVTWVSRELHERALELLLARSLLILGFSTARFLWRAHFGSLYTLDPSISFSDVCLPKRFILQGSNPTEF